MSTPTYYSAAQFSASPPPRTFGQFGPPSDTGRLQPRFHGSAWTLFGIEIVNWLLTMITLGIYSCWAKVRVRHFIYNQTEFAGDRLTYHGTGRELFIGLLKLLAFGVMAAVVLGGIGWILPTEIKGLVIVFTYLTGLGLIPFALWGGRRYQMSRTSWRGIRFSFRGSLQECYELYLLGGLLTVLTLGCYYPWFRANLRHYWLTHTYFGNTPFTYNGSGSELFTIYLRYWLGMLACLVFAIFTIMSIGGLAMMSGGSMPRAGMAFWIIVAMLGVYVGIPMIGVLMAAAEHRFHWSHTQFTGIRFESSVSGGGLLLRKILQGLALALTAGLAFAWVQIDTLRFYYERLALLGEPDFAKIDQEARETPTATAEGLADAFDVDVGFGVA
ncbi:MAG: DUF898 domain-containing protein [Deltaproteobacteria bacterium]|nr:DUF898 domain-containing protein [Deltaproteobacteria bacterium]